MQSSENQKKTKRKILQLFLFGKLSLSNKKKRNEYDSILHVFFFLKKELFVLLFEKQNRKKKTNQNPEGLRILKLSF